MYSTTRREAGSKTYNLQNMRIAIGWRAEGEWSWIEDVHNMMKLIKVTIEGWK